MLVESFSAADLRAFLELQCERFLAWAAQETAHRVARDAALATLPFPYASFRTGQRQLAENVYKAAISGRTLLAQAPTGIGKTVGTLYPQLKSMPGQKLDKLYFLAAKTPGRALALEALRTISAPQAGAPATADVLDAGAVIEAARALPRRTPLRVIELVARDKACEHPTKACHGDSCPLAKGFYDRLPAARQAAVGATPDAAPRLDRGGLRAIALRARGLPVLPRAGAGALGRRGGRRLQLLLRPRRHAARPGARQRLARRRAGRRGAQPGAAGPRDVLGHAVARGARRRAPARARHGRARAEASRAHVERDHRPPARAVRGATRSCRKAWSPRCRTSTPRSATTRPRTPTTCRPSCSRSTSTRCTSRAWPSPSARIRCST